MRSKRDMGLFDFLKIDRYYKMDNKKLVEEAVKYRIEGYGTYPNGLIIRERIIDQLLKKDIANNSRFATFISFFALAVSISTLIVSVIALTK